MKTAWDGDGAPSRADVEGRFRAEGLDPSTWGNGPGDTYGWHSHGYHKVLYCVSGGIVFHVEGGDGRVDVDLAPGDRLDVPPGTRHAATVGPKGVECMEASK